MAIGSGSRSRLLRVGIEYGLCLAVVLILWAGAAWMVTGGPRSDDDLPFSFGAVVFLYGAGGALGGAIGGALFPLAATRKGA